MVTHFFIAFCFALFFITILYALLAIVWGKKEYRAINYYVRGLRIPVVSPVLLLFTLFVLWVVLYVLTNTETYKEIIKTMSPDGLGMGGIGDLFNGLVTPVISVISIIYLWKAFVQQYEANNMLKNFEIEKIFRDDISWLRNNDTDLLALYNSMVGLDEMQFEQYVFDNQATFRKAIYVIRTFQRLFRRIALQRREFEHVNEEVSLLLSTFFLTSLKEIFSVLHANCRNTGVFTADVNYSRVDVDFLVQFSVLYNLLPHRVPDGLFEVTLGRANADLKL